MPLPLKYPRTLRTSSEETDEPPRRVKIRGALAGLRGTLLPSGAGRATALAAVLCAALLSSGCEQDAEESRIEPEPAEEHVDAPYEPEDDEPSADVALHDDERPLERKIRDASIVAQIQIALAEERSLRPFDFEPTVVDGRVLLRGEVQTGAQRNDAERVAAGIRGVREIVNEITATQEPATASSDSDASVESFLADATDGTPALSPEEGESGTGNDQPADGTAGDGVADQSSESQADATRENTGEEAVYHTVRSGDSLWEIAREYGISIDQIRQQNNLQSNRLMPGQRLRVR